jgi:hypothetical protein
MALLELVMRPDPVYGHDEFLRRLLIHSGHAKSLPPPRYIEAPAVEGLGSAVSDGLTGSPGS